MIETKQPLHRRAERTVVKTRGGLWLRVAVMAFAVLAVIASCVVGAAAAHASGL